MDSIGVLIVAAALVAGALCRCCAAAGSACPGGRTIYVSPAGRSGAPGSREAPLGSVQEALDVAVAGDTVHLLPGAYRERVQFRRSGEYLRPVTLEGEPGAILDGSEPVMLRWEPRPDIGPGVYAAHTPFWPSDGEAPWSYGLYVPGAPFFPFTITADGKIVTALEEWRVDPERQEDPKWQWPRIFRDGIGPYRPDTDSGWEGVKALVMYRRKQQELLIRFQDGRDPNQTAITVSPMDPVITIQGTDRCVVRGVTIRNGAKGVYIENSLGSVVERCTIGPADFGVMLRRGADRCTVRFNEIFMDPFAGASPRQKGAWDNWLAVKVGGFSDRDGILMLSSRGGHQIHDNYIHDHWDGIEDWITGAWREGEPDSDETGCDHNLNIHHNRLSNISDDGLEPNGEEVNCEWHDNIVEGCICGFRIKEPRLGPMYAYRNVFLNNRQDYRNNGEVPQRGGRVYVYHNTSTADSAIVNNHQYQIGTPNYHYYNNLFWCRRPQWLTPDSTTPPNWTADYNVYVCRGDACDPGWSEMYTDWEQGRAEIAKRRQDVHSRWLERGLPGFADFAHKDVSLTSDSPARGQGTDLSRLFDKPLPGCPPGYFQGGAPDAGALQFGEPMPRLPRKPEEVDCPPAGSWPPPADAH
ncbi:MAG: NosD domain-containing protein [Armatimonadota bacterium]